MPFRLKAIVKDRNQTLPKPDYSMTIALIVYLPEGIFLLQSNGNCLHPVP